LFEKPDTSLAVSLDVTTQAVNSTGPYYSYESQLAVSTVRSIGNTVIAGTVRNVQTQCVGKMLRQVVSIDTTGLTGVSEQN